MKTDISAVARADDNCEMYPWKCVQYPDFPEDPLGTGDGGGDPWAFCGGTCFNPCRMTSCTATCASVGSCLGCCGKQYSRAIRTRGCNLVCQRLQEKEREACQIFCEADR